MKFTSPTINMYSDNENYMYFLKDIKSHFEQPMMEVHDTTNNLYKGVFSYPRGRVGDSEWIFNHDVCFETALKRWNKGVERFNYNNFLVIMTLYSDGMAYEFDSLPIEHKIGFYWKDLNLDSVVCIPEWNNPQIRSKFDCNFSNIVNRVAEENMGIRSINWMNALQHKGDIRRVF